MAKRSLMIAALAIFASACSHTWFQFHLNTTEENGIIVAQQSLAAGDLGVIDLNGRRAIETLLAGMTLEQTEGDEQFQQLTRALYMGVMENGQDPLAAINMDTLTIASRFAHRVATASGLDPFGLGQMAAAMVGIPIGDDDGTRLGEMQASLQAGQIGTCTGLEPIISYDAGILQHIHSQIAENDPVYLDWRARVRAIHLVRFTCAGGPVIMLFTHNAGEPAARAIGWHFLSDGQWNALDPQLRQAFDLPIR